MPEVLCLPKVLGTRELVQVAREHLEHWTRLRQFAAPQSVHRDSIKERTQALAFIFGVTPLVELTRFGQDPEGNVTYAVNSLAEPDRGRTKRTVGQRKDAQLDLRNEFQAPFLVERKQLQEQPINKGPASELKCGDPGGNPVLNELQAELPQGMLRGKSAPQ